MAKPIQKRKALNEIGRSPIHEQPKRRRIGLKWAYLGVLSVAGVAAGAIYFSVTSPTTNQPTVSASTFVGSETCVGCHQNQGSLWRTSQHNHAMAHATKATVLGDFSDVTFDYFGVRSRFFQRDNKFLVETDGPDGKLTVFEVKYTFGIDPLQQYLIEFADGRLQALSIAWDARPKGKGGQRWFHLYPDEKIAHDDVLHWTKLNQNWNFMCAECHSTGVRKNYDAATDRYKTTWSEISVGCEGCHGQGSRHLEWARAKQSWWPFGKIDDPSLGLLVRYAERLNVNWSLDPKTGNSTRNVGPAQLRTEVETCGLCHSRRGQFSEDWVPGRWLSNTHAVSPLSRGLYHPDGQMRDEVYNYGSFKQSKMYAAGVTCSDCHDPHSSKQRYAGDKVCLQCHASEKFSAASHHQHAAVNQPVTCTSCHMPTRTYMVVDPRHDHSFRIPRPDLSAQFGTPNACNDCHTDKTPQWAASAVERWHGAKRKGFQNYVGAFDAAWQDKADAARLLAAVAADGTAPPIARAGALVEMSSRLSSSTIELARSGLSNFDPMVRIAALDMLDGVPAAQVWTVVAPLLSDAVRGVRIRAVSLLAGASDASRPPGDRERFDRAAEEFIAAQRSNADRPESRSSLGSFLMRSGHAAEAENEYKAALHLSPQYVPASINLADLYRQLGRETEGESALRSALEASPRDAGLHHVLGLTLARLKKVDEAVGELRQANVLDPSHARYAYVYAVALHSAGEAAEAISLLKKTAIQHPQDRDTLMALVTFSRDAGEVDTALQYAEQLVVMFPEDRGLNRLIQELREHATKRNVQ